MKNINELKNIEDFVANKGTNEYTFVALKPSHTDLLTAEIVMRLLTENGYEVVYAAPAIYTKENVQIHYKEIFDKFMADPNGKFSFYKDLEEYLTRGPIFGFVIKGKNAVKGVKSICGATRDPEPGSMRFETFKKHGKPYDINENGIHASGEINEAQREIANFISASLVFPKDNHKLDHIKNFVENYSSTEQNER